MKENKKENVKALEILAREDMTTWDRGDGVIVATVSLPDSEPMSFTFNGSTSSEEIVLRSMVESNVQLSPLDYKRTIDILDRGKEFAEFKIEIGNPKLFNLSFERKPREK